MLTKYNRDFIFIYDKLYSYNDIGSVNANNSFKLNIYINLKGD